MGFDGQFAKFRADEVGLTSYIYYGTIIRDSRDFCVEHVNKIFTEEEAIEEAIATSPIENTRTETLCQWIDSLSSPWPHGVLEETSDSTLEMTAGAYTVFGFDVSPSRRNGSLVAGQILPDGRIGIGILETYSSQVAIDELKMQKPFSCGFCLSFWITFFSL